MSEAALKMKKATYQDIVDLPEGITGEIIAGELYTQPRPAVRHSAAASSLGMLFAPFGTSGGGGPGGWRILDEPELHLGEHVLVPDLAGWKRERMPTLPDTAAITIAPDWVCEILSPSTGMKDRTKKMPLYGAFNVLHLWLIDPIATTVEAYRLTETGWLLIGNFGGAQTASIEPFQAVAFNLALLWE